MSYIKLIYLSFMIFGCSYTSASASNVCGFWQTVDNQTHQPTSIIAFYPYQGKIYGKIIASYDKQGNLDETLYIPRSRAKGRQERPHYCGLDIIWVNPTIATVREPAKGHVVDPRSGKIYSAKLWIEKGNLVLRGEFMMFGKNEVLLPCPEQNFIDGFQKPDLYHLIPTSFH